MRNNFYNTQLSWSIEDTKSVFFSKIQQLKSIFGCMFLIHTLNDNDFGIMYFTDFKGTTSFKTEKELIQYVLEGWMIEAKEKEVAFTPFGYLKYEQIFHLGAMYNIPKLLNIEVSFKEMNNEN